MEKRNVKMNDLGTRLAAERTIRPNILTERAKSWLSSGESIRLLHRFESVINLANAQNEIVSIHNQAIPIGPHSISVTDNDLELIQHQSRFEIEHGMLRFPGGVIQPKNRPIWDSVPDWGFGTTMKIRPIDHRLDPSLAHGLDMMIEGLIKEDDRVLKNGVLACVGRGQGLTPAGDDVMIGFIYGCWSAGRFQNKHGEVISRSIDQRTTTLSTAMIHAAVDGQANQLWHDLLRQRPGALEAIAKTGQTSGRDALVGYVRTVQAIRMVQHGEEK